MIFFGRLNSPWHGVLDINTCHRQPQYQGLGFILFQIQKLIEEVFPFWLKFLPPKKVSAIFMKSDCGPDFQTWGLQVRHKVGSRSLKPLLSTTTDFLFPFSIFPVLQSHKICVIHGNLPLVWAQRQCDTNSQGLTHLVWPMLRAAISAMLTNLEGIFPLLRQASVNLAWCVLGIKAKAGFFCILSTSCNLDFRLCKFPKAVHRRFSHKSSTNTAVRTNLHNQVVWV